MENKGSNKYTLTREEGIAFIDRARELREAYKLTEGKIGYCDGMLKELNLQPEIVTALKRQRANAVKRRNILTSLINTETEELVSLQNKRQNPGKAA